MALTVKWTSGALADRTYWQKKDRRVLKKIADLVASAAEDPKSGLGKPEVLRHYEPKPAWSRRISDEHRLVYTVKGNELWILQCRFHY